MKVVPRHRSGFSFALLGSAASVAMLGLFSVFGNAAHAHGSGHAVRYVAADGVDRGDCVSPSAPCLPVRISSP